MEAEIEGFRNDGGKNRKASEEENNIPKVVLKKGLSDKAGYAFPWFEEKLRGLVTDTNVSKDLKEMLNLKSLHLGSDHWCSSSGEFLFIFSAVILDWALIKVVSESIFWKHGIWVKQMIKSGHLSSIRKAKFP